MAGGQRRFWNWKDDDLTIDISQWLIGLIDSGRYRGYDAVLDSTMVLKLNHDTTGAIRVDKDENYTDKFGVVSTKQGVIIQEYDLVELTIEPTAANKHRKDLVVLNHKYIEVIGGEQALYSIIKGNEVDTTVQAEAPLLPNEELQTIIGTLYLPASVSGLNDTDVAYTPAPQPNFSNHVDFIAMSNGFFITDLDASSNKIVNLSNPTEAQDAATKSYVDQSILNNIVWATEAQRGIAKLLSSSDVISALNGTLPDHSKILTIKRWLQAYGLKVASQSETNGNVEDSKFVTPKTLGNRFSTETRKGVARIATEAEALLGEDDTTIITPFKLKKALPLVPIIVEIGGWDLSGTAPHTKTVTHGLGAKWDKVVAVDLLIVEDDQSARYLPTIQGMKVTTTDVDLTVSDVEAGADLNSTSVNRGYVTFWIKENLPDVANILNVNAGGDTNIFANFNEGSQMSPFYILDGFVEAIGSPVASTLWTVVSKPTGATVVIDDDTLIDTTMSISHYGVYEMKLTATNDDGDTASDNILIAITEQTNTPPVINYILSQQYASQDPTWQHPDGLLAIGGWMSCGVGINATDIDGDVLVYDIIEVESFNHITGAIGPPRVYPPATGGFSNGALEFEQSPTNPNAWTIHGMRLYGHFGATPPSGSNFNGNLGVGFYYFKAIVDDGNGGTAEKGFRVKTKNYIGGNGNGGNTSTFDMSISPNGTQTLNSYYSGFVIMNPVSEVATMRAVIAAQRTSGSNNSGNQNLDVILQIGSGSGSFYGEGDYLLNPAAIQSSSPFTFQVANVGDIISATVTFKAYNSSGVLLDQHSLYLSV